MGDGIGPAPGRGMVILLTGLSGAGKSTIARLVADWVLEVGSPTVSVLDGDVVRRHLSARLGFSEADRDLNVRTIGLVAAEIARHGGLALCCAIAPYERSRVAVREYAEAVGARFALVHVSTPLAVCQRRDRKGLYARANAGLLTGVTGVDDPYEVPGNPELTIDTSLVPSEVAAGRVLDLVRTGSGQTDTTR